jgi:hypothetical protein
MKSISTLSLEEMKRMNDEINKLRLKVYKSNRINHTCFICGLDYSNKLCIVCDKYICPIHSTKTEIGFICSNCHDN